MAKSFVEPEQVVSWVIGEVIVIAYAYATMKRLKDDYPKLGLLVEFSSVRFSLGIQFIGQSVRTVVSETAGQSLASRSSTGQPIDPSVNGLLTLRAP